MENYIGTKAVRAEEMTEGVFKRIIKNESPINESFFKNEGYLVEYLDSPNRNSSQYENYVSWSPKDVFERSYRKVDGLTFGQAIELAKAGKKVARKGWNGANMFAYIVPANFYPARTEIAKQIWGENGVVPYRAYWALKTAQHDVAA